MTLLSVIIPAFNRSKLLIEAIDSLCAQTFEDFEVIIVDDGSTDDTLDLLNRHLESKPLGKFKVIHQDHAGSGVARNLAIANARGKYCVFLDSDDLLFPWSLATIAEAITGHGEPSVLLIPYTRFTAIDELRAITSLPLRVTAWPDLYAYAVHHHLGVTGTLVARRDAIQQVGGFATAPMIGEGADLMLQLGVIPNILTIDAPLLYAYRVRPETVTNPQRWFRRGTELIDRYRSGAFPGGSARAAELRIILARDAAYFSLVCLHLGDRKKCLSLYLKTMGLQLRSLNFGFLLRTPALVALSLIKRG